MPESTMNRRHFLCTVAGTVALAITGGALASGCKQGAPAKPETAADELPNRANDAKNAKSLAVGSKAEIVEAGSKPFTLTAANGRSISGIAVADSSGDIRAFDTTCTHMGCQVNYEKENNSFFCPCHQGQFDGNGQVVSGPPQAPLKSLHLEVKDNMVWVTP